MTKDQIIAQVSTETGFTKKDVSSVVSALGNVLKKALTSKEKVALPEIGTWSTKERSARKVKSPADPTKIIDIPATTVVKYLPAKSIRDAVAGK